MNTIIVSKSKIKTYENCPLLFRWRYIDKRIPDIPPAAVTTIGLDVHQIFNRFYDVIKLEEIPQDPIQYFIDSLHVLLQYQNIYNLFCRFQSKRWKLTKNKEEFMPLLREYKITNNGEVGIIDVVHNDSGEYSVLDYKSSASNPTDLRFELNFYAKILNDSSILDKPVKYIGAYGYKTGDIFYEEINTKSYNLMLKKVDAFKNIDWENIEFSKVASWACNWCQYSLSCAKV